MRLLLSSFFCITLAFFNFSYADSTGDAAYIASMMAIHAADTPVASPGALEKPEMPVLGAEVTYATVAGKPVKGYLSRPAAAKSPLPGVIVVHEWWGLNDNVRHATDRLAGEGYEVLAVDLYGGQSAATSDQAQALVKAVYSDTAPVKDNLKQAYGFLHDHEHATSVGVMGWCFGGGWALQTALLLPDKLRAAVMYYGQPVTDVQQLATLKMPLLGLFGEADTGITVADVTAFEKALKDAKVDAEIHEYPGAGHAFANPSGTRYNPVAAEDAWKRTVKFFKAHLH